MININVKKAVNCSLVLSFFASTPLFAAEQLWNADIVSPVPYDGSGVAAPIEAGITTVYQDPNAFPMFRNIAVTPSGKNIVLYNAMIKRQDGANAKAIGLQLRDADGRKLFDHIEPYTAALSNATITDPKGYDSNYVALFSSEAIWVATSENNGEQIFCKIITFKSNLTKRAEAKCPTDLPVQTVEHITPLSDKLAVVQFRLTEKNLLLNRNGEFKPFPNPIGKILASQHLWNGDTALLTEATAGRLQIVRLSATGAVRSVNSMPDSVSPGVPFTAAMRLASPTKLVVSLRAVVGSPYFEQNTIPSTSYVSYNLANQAVEWTKKLDAATDFDVYKGHVIAIGRNYMETSYQLFDIAPDGHLITKTIQGSLDNYAAFLELVTGFFVPQTTSALAVQNGKLALRYSDINGLTGESATTTATIDQATGNIIKTESSPGTFMGIGRDWMNNLYGIKYTSDNPLPDTFNYFDFNNLRHINIDKVGVK